MLSTARVTLPAPVQARLKTTSELVDNVMEFAREDLVGFRRPLAATFAFSAPLVLAIVYQSAGVLALVQVAAAYVVVATGGLWLVGRNLWPEIVEKFEERTVAKRKAAADLKCGFGEAAHLYLAKPPMFLEYANGALVFADAGDFRTLFFSIQADAEDPRWAIYRNGQMRRQIWRWLRLPVSREIVRFTAEGEPFPKEKARRIASIDAFEAINVALGEPMDGAVIHRCFDDVVETVERLL